MAAREDLFTPIHKAIRSMIYGLGGRLQSNDFADSAATAPLLADLEHEFSAAMSAGCVLCLIHHHASDEEGHVFPHVARFDPKIVAQLIDEHHSLGRRLAAITSKARAIPKMDRAEDRIGAGIVLNAEVNEFFAAYLTHMNLEDTAVVPMMREHFTDDHMAAMRGAVLAGMPPERVGRILRWMLPSLNITEATAMLVSLKRTSPPPVYQFVRGLAEASLAPDRWNELQRRVG